VKKKTYDHDYYERWYGDRATRIVSAGELQRRVAMVVALTEFVLDRPIRSVLDVGCGDARWLREIKRIRPSTELLGIESSDYVVKTYSGRFRIERGSFGELDQIAATAEYDLVICSDVLHYLSAAEIDRGLSALTDHLFGVAYLSVHTVEDEPVGDLEGWKRRTAAWYRTRFARAGLVACGMQCYVGPLMEDRLTALEKFE
jgi:SAM-dependent methyltransferase